MNISDDEKLLVLEFRIARLRKLEADVRAKSVFDFRSLKDAPITDAQHSGLICQGLQRALEIMDGKP